MQSLSSTFNENYFILITVMSFFITERKINYVWTIFTHSSYLFKIRQKHF